MGDSLRGRGAADGDLRPLVSQAARPAGKGHVSRFRIDRLVLGLPGDVRPVGEGVSELRVDDGPGYRVYFAQRGETLIVLLAGGDKGSQDRDISTALVLARSL